MIIYAQPPTTDASFNLAFEQHLFENSNPEAECFMLWRNRRCIVMGKHQNAFEELNLPFIRQKNIPVFRRISGGGTVFHDAGNINFSFISERRNMAGTDLSVFSNRVSNALRRLGLATEVTPRNDILLDGLKISGNAQCIRKGRVLHHGTILYDAELPALRRALTTARGEVASGSVKSVPSSVTNLKPRLTEPMDTEAFMDSLKNHMYPGEYLEYYRPDAADLEKIRLLQEKTYRSWAWNYGASPSCRINKTRRFPNASTVEITLEITGGRITRQAFSVQELYGRRSEHICRACAGVDFKYQALYAALEAVYAGKDAARDNVHALTCMILE